ncbi:hypothetical protein EIP91_008792 [Steccherinum ochraceum]|uniref:Uncharacterized protein n=1 Tax=Steccherinum ochraceum TaxID=92696 RepID=A0A4R0RFP6_9APHY|nr:hypothetical protein EIP91_008792 [Steccherinum ochraceum]
MRFTVAFATLVAASFPATFAAPLHGIAERSVYTRSDISAIPFRNAIEPLNNLGKRVTPNPGETPEEAKARDDLAKAAKAKHADEERARRTKAKAAEAQDPTGQLTENRRAAQRDKQRTLRQNNSAMREKERLDRKARRDKEKAQKQSQDGTASQHPPNAGPSNPTSHTNFHPPAAAGAQPAAPHPPPMEPPVKLPGPPSGLPPTF